MAATLALVFSMTGGALAAKHYLVNSTKQINPKVLKALKGRAGKNGATGPQGPKGVGSPGPAGSVGPTGPEGPLVAALPSGHTETGLWGNGWTAAGGGAGYFAVASFPIPLATTLDGAHTIFVSGASAPHCSGAGHAEPGFLCVYGTDIENATTPTSGNIFNVDAGGPPGAGPRGFAIFLTSTAGGTTLVSGTYAVTAP